MKITNVIAFNKDNGELVDMVQFENHISLAECMEKINSYQGGMTAFKDGKHNLAFEHKEKP